MNKHILSTWCTRSIQQIWILTRYIISNVASLPSDKHKVGDLGWPCQLERSWNITRNMTTNMWQSIHYGYCHHVWNHLFFSDSTWRRHFLCTVLQLELKRVKTTKQQKQRELKALIEESGESQAKIHGWCSPLPHNALTHALGIPMQQDYKSKGMKHHL
jgi:hypothetical protein